MTRATYRADNSLSGMGGFIAKDAKLQAAMTAVAEAGKAYAQSIAPYVSGEYYDGFGVSNESGRPDSVGAMLYNDSDHAAAVEYEHSHTLAKTTDYLNNSMDRP